MLTEETIREMYQENREIIRKEVLALPNGYMVEVGFFRNGNVVISNPIPPRPMNYFIDWSPAFTMSLHASKSMSYETLDDEFERAISAEIELACLVGEEA